MPLSVWFEAAWLLTVNKNAGVSAAHLHRILPINSYQTARTMVAKFRSVMSSSNSQLLAGRVENDETFLGGPKAGVRGRGALGKIMVAGAIEVTETGWGRARLGSSATPTHPPCDGSFAPISSPARPSSQMA